MYSMLYCTAFQIVTCSIQCTVLHDVLRHVQYAVQYSTLNCDIYLTLSIWLCSTLKCDTVHNYCTQSQLFECVRLKLKRYVIFKDMISWDFRLANLSLFKPWLTGKNKIEIFGILVVPKAEFNIAQNLRGQLVSIKLHRIWGVNWWV